MVSPAPPARQGTVSDLINRLLDRDYNRTVQPVLNAITRSTNSGLIQQRLNELDTEAARLIAAEQRLRPDNPVLRALLADLDDTLRADSRLIDTAAQPLQQTAIDAAGKIQRQLALPGVTDAQLRRLGIIWNRPDPEAVARLVSYAQSDAWAATLARYSDDILQIVNNQAIRGIALGWNPIRTAREITRMTEMLPRHQANNLMRTLQLTSYRDSTAAHQQANLAIANQIVRIAALDTRTCLSCVASHGDIIWDSERDVNAPVPRVDDHHSGRCTSVMLVKGRDRSITTGAEWFNSLPPDRQAQQRSFVDSPGKLDAFQRGEVSLRDFRRPYTDPTFGPMLREASLTDALNNRRNSFTPPPTGPGRGPIIRDGQIVTTDGLRPLDTGSPGDSLSSLETFLERSNGPLAEAITDFDTQMVGFDANARLVINRDNVRTAAKQFVVESQDIQYSRSYIVQLAMERAEINGVTLRDIDGEQLYNQYMATRAQAIRSLAEIGNVRLTEPQQRRLRTAIEGNYLDMVYTTASSERGSLANRAQRNRGRTAGLTGAEKRQARENFRNWVQGID